MTPTDQTEARRLAAGHVQRMIESADRMARRMGGRFVVDPERMENLRSVIERAVLAEGGK